MAQSVQWESESEISSRTCGNHVSDAGRLRRRKYADSLGEPAGLHACGGSSATATLLTRPDRTHTVGTQAVRKTMCGTYYIGGDLEPRERLRHILTENGIRYYIGASRDGVGVDRLANFLDDLKSSDGTDRFGLSGNGFYPFAVQPFLYFDSDFLKPENADIFEAVYGSILILNDVLPPEYQIVMSGVDNPNVTYSGEIEVHLETAESISSIVALQQWLVLQVAHLWAIQARPSSTSQTTWTHLSICIRVQ